MPTLMPHLRGTPPSVTGASMASNMARTGSVSEACPFRACDQQSELVAAEACDGAVILQRVLEADGDLLQERVSGIVTEDVVDVLEAVEIDQPDGKLS